jgi:aromatic ring hydroxylase
VLDVLVPWWYVLFMSEIVEIKPQVYAVRMDGHLLRQHYFTRESAQMELSRYYVTKGA